MSAGKWQVRYKNMSLVRPQTDMTKRIWEVYGIATLWHTNQRVFIGVFRLDNIKELLADKTHNHGFPFVRGRVGADFKS